MFERCISPLHQGSLMGPIHTMFWHVGWCHRYNRSC